jgi:hypothetical protein
MTENKREKPRAAEGSGAVSRSATKPYGVRIPAGPPQNYRWKWAQAHERITGMLFELLHAT